MEFLTRSRSELVASHLDQALDYDSYRSLVFELAEKGLSTDPQLTELNAQFTKLNAARMRRLDKTLKIEPDVEQAFREFREDQTWVVVTESWCGDAAQVIPVINKLAELSENIKTRFVLRDWFPDLIDGFLTNGTRSIPILIAIDNESGEVIYTWGPRPEAVQQKVLDYIEEHGMLTPDFKAELQQWYNKDRGKSISRDFLKLIR